MQATVKKATSKAVKKVIKSHGITKSMTATPLPIITITFPFTIKPDELPAFRGAIVDVVMQYKKKFDKAGIATDLFHNHREDESSPENPLIMRQPMITYQLMRPQPQKATVKNNVCPAVCGYGPGAAALQLLLPLLPAQLTIYRKLYETRGYQTIIQSHLIQLQSGQLTEYALYKWLALNPDNYTLYKNTWPFTQRVLLLQDILKKNLQGWCRQAGHPLPEELVQVHITEITGISHDRTVLHGRQMLCFDICFAINASLPGLMAMGIGTAHGYGKLRQLNSGLQHRQSLQQLADAVL